MSRIPVQTLDSVPEQTRATLQKLARRSGTLLNIHAEMASTPVVLAAYAGLSDAVASRAASTPGPGRRSPWPWARSMAVTTARPRTPRGAGKPGSRRRKRSRSAAGRWVSMTGSPRCWWCCVKLREAAGNVGHVSDQAWNTARAAGWNEQELGEAFAHLAGNLFTNFFNHHARTDLDVPPPRSFAEHRMTHRARRRGPASVSQRHITAGSNPGCCRVSSP